MVLDQGAEIETAALLLGHLPVQHGDDGIGDALGEEGTGVLEILRAPLGPLGLGLG